MTHAEVKAILQQYYSEALDRVKGRIDRDGALPLKNLRNISRELAHLDELIDSDGDDYADLYGLEYTNDEKPIHEDLKPILERFDLNLDPNSKEYSMFSAAYKYARRNHFRDVLAYNEKVYDYSLLDVENLVKPKPSKQSKTLSQLIDLHLSEIKGTLGDRGYADKADCLVYLVDFCGGEIAASAIDVDEVQQVKKALMSTPTGRNKSKIVRGKPLMEQIDFAASHALPVLSATSVNKYLGYFDSLYGWAKTNKLVSTNPFEGVRVKNNKKANRREMFKKGEITQILTELETNTLGTVKNKSQYWGALIAIYTGARRNEVAGLMVGDVKHDDASGIWYFDITDEEEQGKGVKTEAAKRLVPIHSKLIDLGFLGYLEHAKQIVSDRSKEGEMGPRLLYDLTYTNHDKWGRKLGRYVNEKLLKGLGLHDSNKRTLHSFRHSFITHLVAAGVQVDAIQALVGHEQDTVTKTTYTHYGVEHLPSSKEVIEKLVY